MGEWKAKADDLHAELDACHSECRNFSAETFRMKAALDDTNEQLDIVRRENKNLADEIKVPIPNFRFDPMNYFTQLMSRIFWISLAMVAGPFMSWTNRGGGWRQRRRSFSQLWR